MTDRGPLAPAAERRPTARKRSFLHDVLVVARRSIILLPREPEAVIPALIIPVFFFVVNVGSLQNLTESMAPGLDFKGFQLPVAIIFAVTGISRAPALVVDIQEGYFDRMLVSPLSRRALLIGLMVSDMVLVTVLTLPVVGLGLVLGVRFAAGPLGIAVFIILGAVWGLAYTGFPYAIALKTGSPAAVNSSFLLFFPFAFLTTVFVPLDAMTSWLASVARYNPLTYVLEGLRSVVLEGWDGWALLRAVLAISLVALVSQTLSFLALRGRVSRS